MGSSSSKNTSSKTEQILGQAHMSADSISPENLSYIESLPDPKKKEVIRQLQELNTQANQQIRSAVQQAKQSKIGEVSPLPLTQSQSTSVGKLSGASKSILEARLVEISNEFSKKAKAIITGHKKSKAAKASVGAKAAKGNLVCKEWRVAKKTDKKKPKNPLSHRVLKPKGPTAKTLNKVCKSVRKSCVNPDVSPRTHKPYSATSSKKKLLHKICGGGVKK